jgi:hypothetical protein
MNFFSQPLTSQAIIEGFKKDIDRTLIRENLKLSHEQRLLKLMQLQRFADELAFPTSEYNLCSCGFLVYPP